MPQSIITESYCKITHIRYSAEAHLYWSTQPSVFSHIVLNDDANNFLYFNSWIKHLLCEVVVAEYFLLSYDKKEWNTAWYGHDFVDEFIPGLVNVLKCSSAIPSIDTDIFTL